MNRYVTDTHSVIWYLSRDEHLSETARDVFRKTDAGQSVIFIPSIVIVEIVYLTEKWRIPDTIIQNVLRIIQRSSLSYPVASLDLEIAKTLQKVSREAIPDMPDRIIAATATYLKVPLITRDTKIQNARLVPIVW